MNQRPIIAAAPLLALAACGASGDGAADKGAPQVNPADISVATPGGRVDVRSGEAALAGLPEGIPVYPGAEAQQGVQVRGAGPANQGQILGFRTGDPPAQVINFYADRALRARYAITQQMSAGPTAMLTATRDGQMLNISATRMGDVIQIQIIAGLGQ